MPYAERLVTCAGCGTVEVARWSPTKPWRCIHCAIERSVMNALQLRAKRGAFYDKWAAGIARAGQLAVEHSEANKADEQAG